MASVEIKRSDSHLAVGRLILVSVCINILKMLDSNLFEEGILISCEIGVVSSKLSVGDLIVDLICRYCRKCLLVMPNFWTKSANGVENMSLVNRCCRCVMPLSFQVQKLSVCLLQVKSGLFQIGVSFEGECFVLVMLWNFHQAVRPELMVGALKQGCFLIVGQRSGRSEIWRSLQILCSKSSQVISDWLWWVHLYTC